MNSHPKKYFDELTGIRAIAAYLVFFHHFNFFKAKYFGYFIYNFVNELHIGVTIFFVLSGFLISFRYIDNLNLKSSKWLLQYFLNRIGRIYPLYFILATITFAFLTISTNNFKETFLLYITNITFFKGFFDDLKFSGIAQSWTLTVEECFYFSAPLIFAYSKKIKLIYIFICIYAFGILAVLVFRNSNFFGFFGNFKFLFLYTFWGRSFEFYIGIVLAKYYKKYYTNTIRTKPLKTYSGIILMFLCVVALSLLMEKELGLFKPLGILINNFILPVGISLLLLGLITENSILNKFLSSKLLVLLGKSSYAFYLIHLGLFSHQVFRYAPNPIIAFIILNIISILLFRFIEEPCNVYIRKLYYNNTDDGRKSKINRVA